MNGEIACICGDQEGIWCYSDECPNRSLGLRLQQLNSLRSEDDVLAAVARLRELTDSGARHELAAVLPMTGMTTEEIDELGDMPDGDAA